MLCFGNNLNKFFFSSIKKPILIDVRSPEEYVSGHIEDAILIPHHEIKETILDEVPDKSTPIQLYCRSGERSHYAKLMIESEGYTNVQDLGSYEKASKYVKEHYKIK